MEEEARAKTAIRIPVFVIADWDADGATAAAMIYYAQKFKGIYPIRGKVEVGLAPSGPRGFTDTLKEFLIQYCCPKVLVVLDIPFTDKVYTTLLEFSRTCKDSRIVYIDHHYSTMYSSIKLYKLTEEVYLGHKPTAILTYNLLRSVGLRKLTPRLEAFMNAVGVLEKGGIKRGELDEIVRIAASISKASTVLRDKELWIKLVKWLSSPLPEQSPVSIETINRVLEIAAKSDKELEEKAKELAFSARRIGFIKFIDARRKWKGRGASALASKLYKVLRQPIALLTERDDGVKLLIIRSKGASAYRIATGLLSEGIAENIGGHSSLAVVRLKDGV